MIVVSDMMGTLTTGSPFLGLMDWVKHNQSKLHASLYMAAITPSYILAKNGWIDWQKWGQDLTVSSLAHIKNATPEKVAQAAAWITEHNLWPKRRADVIERLSKHRESGAKVYIVSSVMEPFIEPFARRIGVDYLGTPTEIVAGKFRIVGRLVADEGKTERILNHLGVKRVDVAYGDTVLDIPMLERAEHPVAVYPDPKLKQHALAKGWEIIGDTPKREK